MLNRKLLTAVLAVVFSLLSTTHAQSLEDNFNDLLHYTRIGRFDLAAGYAQAVLQADPDPQKLLALSRDNPEGFALLLRVRQAPPDAVLAELTKQILAIIEKGRFIQRAEPKTIAEEVRRLSAGARPWYVAVNRLKNAGEYAIPYMLDALGDESRRSEYPKIVEALPHIGRAAIRPLVAALQTDNAVVRTEIANALGAIGYPQSQPYLKYIVEKDKSAELRKAAAAALNRIDPAVLRVPAAHLFYHLAEQYYYHTESLAPAEDADFANIWFWDAEARRLIRKEVDKAYFNELMAMRCCEWALKADERYGRAIGLWLAAFLKAEATGVAMPDYFGPRHAEAIVYATTAGPEYLHQALARAIKDKNADVALGVVEALDVTAGEKSLLYRLGFAQPLVQALSFDDRAVRYSAAIAIANAGPREKFEESRFVVANLAEALSQSADNVAQPTDRFSAELANSYALRAANALLKLAETRNPVINLSLALSSLVDATKDTRPEIQILAGRILAHLDSPTAQRAIAAMALDINNSLDIRIQAFESLAVSARVNANMLPEEVVDGIYAAIGSDDTDPDLRSAAAAAYGALNLPSRKAKDLIIDQAKS